MLNDLRYAVRTLRRAPGFTISAVLALALGIGANVAVASVVYAVLLKPLPYDDPDRLVRLSEVNPSGADTGVVSIGTFVDWRARSRMLEGIALYTPPANGETLWGAGDRFEGVKSSAASPSLFPILRVRPMIGRTNRPEAEQDQPSGDRGKMVISYGFWQRAFGGASDVIGRRVTVEGRFAAEIIGVMPRGFAFPEGTDAWANYPLVGELPAARRRAQSLHAIARLRDHVSISDARAELRGISAQLAAEQPASNAGWSADVRPLSGDDSAAARPALLALVGAVAGVLLIGCANVANLLLARASGRQRELSVRLALGAGSFRVVRQYLTEALVLAAAGSVTGLVIGSWLTGGLIRLAPPDIPRLGDVRIDGLPALFVAATGLATAAFIGFAPAWQAARADRTGALRPGIHSSTARGRSMRSALIAGEVAVVVLLLTGASLLVRTFVNLRHVDLGFQPRHVLEVSARWPIGTLFPSAPGERPWPRIQRAVDGLLAAVRGVPGVEAVGLISDVPLAGKPFDGVVWRADAAGASGLMPPADLRDRWSAAHNVVSAGYFAAMGVPILRGRNFTDADRLSDAELAQPRAPRAGAIIINRAFASRYFPGDDPIGRSLITPDDQEFGWSRTIVGVVGDVRGHAVSEAAEPAVYVPHAQHPDVFMPSLIVRSSLPADAIGAAIRQRVTAYDPSLLVQRIRPMDAVVSGALQRPRFNVVLVGSFAIVALALSAIGIYGVVAYVVTQRAREIGIRMALGADTSNVLRLVLREGMIPVVGGALAGTAASLVAMRSLKALLFGISPLDPASVGGAPLLLAVVALIACYVPARRATRVDPLVVLRDQ